MVITVSPNMVDFETRWLRPPFFMLTKGGIQAQGRNAGVFSNLRACAMAANIYVCLLLNEWPPAHIVATASGNFRFSIGRSGVSSPTIGRL